MTLEWTPANATLGARACWPGAGDEPECYQPHLARLRPAPQRSETFKVSRILCLSRRCGYRGAVSEPTGASLIRRELPVAAHPAGERQSVAHGMRTPAHFGYG